MFVIVTYDVAEKRCHKIMKFMREWLEHRQNSVFSGYLDHNQIDIMEQGILEIIKPDYDRVIIFKINRPAAIKEWVTKAAVMYGMEAMPELNDVQQERPEDHEMELLSEEHERRTKGMWKLMGTPGNRKMLRKPPRK